MSRGGECDCPACASMPRFGRSSPARLRAVEELRADTEHLVTCPAAMGRLSFVQDRLRQVKKELVMQGSADLTVLERSMRFLLLLDVLARGDEDLTLIRKQLLDVVASLVDAYAAQGLWPSDRAETAVWALVLLHEPRHACTFLTVRHARVRLATPTPFELAAARARGHFSAAFRLAAQAPSPLVRAYVRRRVLTMVREQAVQAMQKAFRGAFASDDLARALGGVTASALGPRPECRFPLDAATRAALVETDCDDYDIVLLKESIK